MPCCLLIEEVSVAVDVNGGAGDECEWVWREFGAVYEVVADGSLGEFCGGDGFFGDCGFFYGVDQVFVLWGGCGGVRVEWIGFGLQCVAVHDFWGACNIVPHVLVRVLDVIQKEFACT